MSEFDAKLAIVAAHQHGVFTVRDALALGFSRSQIGRRLDSGTWTPLHAGVYRASAAPRTWRGDLLGACIAAGRSAVASHRAAAALWGLAGGAAIVEITCSRWRRAQRAEIVVHETNKLTVVDRVTIDGIPVTTPERTALDLGAVRSPRTVEIAVDTVLRRELATLGTLQGTIRRLGHQGRNGVGVLRAIVEGIDPSNGRPESEMERRLVQALRELGFPEPVLQYEIRDGARFVARVDAAYPDRRIAIEYDSYAHHTSRAELDRDARRRTTLTALDWLTLTVTARELRDGATNLGTALLAIWFRRQLVPDSGEK